MSQQDDINQLKAKLQNQAAEFQSYKQECRHIQEMLQEESQKKQEQIKHLKQQAIKKQKGQKIMKTQISQFQAEVQNLKSQLTQVQTNSSTATKGNKEELERLKKQNDQFRLLNDQNYAKFERLTDRCNKLTVQLQEAHVRATEFEHQLLAIKKEKATVKQPQNKVNQSKNDEQFKKLKEKYANLQKQKTKFQKLSKDKEIQIEKLKKQYEQKIKKFTTQIDSKSKQQPSKRSLSSTKQPNKQHISLSEHTKQVNKLKQIINNLQYKTDQFSKIQKQLNSKISSLVVQKNNLLSKTKSISKQLQRQRHQNRLQQQQQQKNQQIYYQSPNKRQPHDEIMIIGGQGDNIIDFNCLLLTKRHYTSPFLQLKDKTIKVFKNTKTGFQKSLGSIKHKFDWIGYEKDAMVEKTINTIKASAQIQGEVSHSVVIYGAKKTSKKYIMAMIINGLKDFLVQLIDQKIAENQQGSQIKCVYMKRSQDQQKNYLKQAINNKQQILEILEEVINLGEKKSPSKSSKKGQKVSKPKIRYFCISISQSLTLQLITTSHMNTFIKNNDTFTDYLNNIIFSKLPNILQSSTTNSHIITTINPIVNLYQQCKNTLSITLVPLKDKSLSLSQQQHQHQQSLLGHNESSPMLYHSNVFSPSNINKEELNDMAKKKLQKFEKQTEQAGIKVHKIQEECQFYRNRFQQLQVRLKKLINTHQQQNTYLKKSPITLSYQSLLKFVISVLTRNQTPYTSKISPYFADKQNNENQNQIQYMIEEDAKSLDGY